MTRKIPVISLEDFEAKTQKRKVYKSIVENITEGIESELESVNIAEIKNHDIMISVPKTEWKGGLENAMDYYIEKEEYEECTKIKKLIEEISK
jgi:transcriptional regulator NrdR family protein